MRIPLPEAFLHLPLCHRGYHDAQKGVIENSLSAFAAAIAAGYGIELDVLLSADGEVMVFHDDFLERLTDASGPVSERSAAELQRLVLRGSSDTIPTLRAVLDFVAGRVPVLVELKDVTHLMMPTDGKLEAAVARDVAGYAGPIALMSYNPHSVVRLAALAPDVPRGITLAGDDPDGWAPATRDSYLTLMQAPDFDRSQSSFISHSRIDLDRPRIAELKAQGAAILCWTIRSPEQEAAARRFVHNITFEGYPAPFIRP